MIGYFAQTIMKDLRLVSGYDVLFGKIKAFVQTELFDSAVDLEDPNTLRNLSELAATKTLVGAFKKAVNALTVQGKGDAQFRDSIKLRQTRPFVAKDQGYLIPRKDHRPFRLETVAESKALFASDRPTFLAGRQRRF